MITVYTLLIPRSLALQLLLLRLAQVAEVVSDVLDHPGVPHQVHQRKVQVFFLVEVLEDSGASDCLANEQDLLQLAAFEDNVFEAAREVHSEEAVDEHYVGEVEGQQANGYFVLH